MSAAPREPPLVSVVTPCFNAAPFVGETIEAVLAQSYPRIELIVVDDASTDGSWEVIRSFGDRIRAVRLEENRHVCHARNQGVARSRGEYLMFLDADDLIEPDTIEALVAAARESPGSIAICDWRRLAPVDGGWAPAPADVALPAAGADPLRAWLEGHWVPTCSILWPRPVYERTGGWDESLTYADDTDIMLRTLVAGTGFAHARGGRSYYRSHRPSHVSHSQNYGTEDKHRSQLRVLGRIVEALEADGRLPAYAPALGDAYHRVALMGFQHGHVALARECARLGEELAGRRPVSRTAMGRLLAWTLGVERKEKLVGLLARLGIATGERRRQMRLHQMDALRAKGGEG